MVNYDMPVERDQRTPNYETYLHRIGRSGRFGRKGAAFNLITGAQVGTAALPWGWQHMCSTCAARVEPWMWCGCCCPGMCRLGAALHRKVRHSFIEAAVVVLRWAHL